MKSSNYNIFVPLRKEKYVLYNTLTDALLIVDQEMKDSLQNFSEGKDMVDSKMLESLKKSGIIVNDDIDEKLVFKTLHESSKYHSMLMSFTILTTYACNLSCPYCYEGKGEKLNKTMDETITKSVIKFIKKRVVEDNRKIFSVGLYGGEPLLNANGGFTILDALDTWVKDEGIGFKVSINSNGTLFTDEIINKWSQYPVSYTQITLDGPKKLHDKKRVHKTGEGTYEIIIRTLEKLADVGANPVIRINVDQENFGHIEELLDDLKSRGLHKLPTYFGMVLPQ
jgi:uncharacterized protein